MKTSFLIAATLIGCGDDGMPKESQTIALHAAGTKLLAIQPVGDEWRSLTVPADGEVSATIPDGPFTLVSVCDEPERFDYYVVYGGTGLSELDVYCTPPANTVKVSLAPGSSGRAAIGNYPLLGNVSWQVKPGTYDVTAYDNSLSPPRFEIRRGVSITADTVLTFDLATTGTPLEEIAVTADALATESVRSSSKLHTAGGTRMTISSMASDPRVWRVPASALKTGDRQSITSVAAAGSSSRTATRTLPNTAVSVALQLPPRLSSASAKLGPPLSAEWNTTGDWNEAFFYAADEDYTVMFDAFVTPEYVAQTGKLTSIELPEPGSVPGWNPGWKLPSTVDLEWSLSLSHQLGGLDSDHASWDGAFAPE
ncbi:MAG: hypothetical protein H0T46_19075 [Deltaproteobacteria bacterium]|nr:hypothetical protein [Deltaproteobacteria bacterium]